MTQCALWILCSKTGPGEQSTAVEAVDETLAAVLLILVDEVDGHIHACIEKSLRLEARWRYLPGLSKSHSSHIMTHQSFQPIIVEITSGREQLGPKQKC